MSDKKRRLENTVAALQERHGMQALHKGQETAYPAPIPHVLTGFATLDQMTGCQGIPLGAITLLSGRTTSGKLTLAYKLLANAQRASHGGVAYAVGLIDLNRTTDPDYLARCGIHLESLLVARPQTGQQAVDALGDLLQTRQLRVIVMDSLADLAIDRSALCYLNRSLRRLQHQLRTAGCALVMLAEPSPPWMRWLNLDSGSLVRWCAALHIEMQRERWLRRQGMLTGYQARARLLKSRWVYGIRSARIEIVFNGTVRAQETW